MAGTNYEDAFKRAFEMADTSYDNNYDSRCQTVYVFLTGIFVFSTRFFVGVSMGLSILMYMGAPQMASRSKVPRRMSRSAFSSASRRARCLSDACQP